MYAIHGISTSFQLDFQMKIIRLIHNNEVMQAVHSSIVRSLGMDKLHHLFRSAQNKKNTELEYGVFITRYRFAIPPGAPFTKMDKI